MGCLKKSGLKAQKYLAQESEATPWVVNAM